MGGVVSLLNFGIHAVMTALIVVSTRRTEARTRDVGIFVRLTALLTVAVTFLMMAHIAEISVWGGMLHWLGVGISNISTFEFAFENYTTLGYGDALPTNQAHRLIGPMMALNGLLLIGWSVAVIFEVMRMAEFQVANDDS